MGDDITRQLEYLLTDLAAAITSLDKAYQEQTDLKAETDRLRASLDHVRIEREAAEAEVERLREFSKAKGQVIEAAYRRITELEEDRKDLIASAKQKQERNRELEEDLVMCEQGYPNVGDLEALKARIAELEEQLRSVLESDVEKWR